MSLKKGDNVATFGCTIKQIASAISEDGHWGIVFNIFCNNQECNLAFKPEDIDFLLNTVPKILADLKKCRDNIANN